MSKKEVKIEMKRTRTDSFIFGFASIMFALNLYWISVFMMIWASPDKRMVININYFNEGLIEMILFILIIIGSIIWLMAVGSRNLGLKFTDRGLITTIALFIVMVVLINIILLILSDWIFKTNVIVILFW